MIRRTGKILRWTLAALLALMVVLAVINRDMIQRTMLGGLKVYETVPPPLPANLRSPAMLVFSKTNGFRHEEAIPAANHMLERTANIHGWGYFQTENGAAFSPAILSKFDLVVFNNASGDVFTPDQRAAFRSFVEGGGGFVGIHAAGDSSHEAWDWYARTMIGAHFTGHPMNPQFQRGTVVVADPSHPATRALPARWQREDEWYFFASPPGPDFHVLARLDEASIPNHKMFLKDLSMGSDHPIMWWRCVGRGRVFFSAMGHLPAAYSDATDTAMLNGALEWAMAGRRAGCPAKASR